MLLLNSARGGWNTTVMMDSETIVGYERENNDADLLLLVPLAEHRLAIHRLLCLLRSKFEPTFSARITSCNEDNTAKTLPKHTESKSQSNTVKGASGIKPIGLALDHKQLDTLQICQVLKRWCVERRKEITIIFSDDVGGEETLSCHTKTTASNDSDHSTPSSSRQHNLAQLVHQLADAVLECRTLIAHNMLSVTAEECRAAMSSVESMIRLLKESIQEERQQPIIGALGGKDTQPLLPHSANLQHYFSPDYCLNLRGAQAKTFIVMELLFALEMSVVEMFRSQAQSDAELPLSIPVKCVSSLCSLLRNEHWHQAIHKATGVHPRPMVIKALLVGEEIRPVADRNAEESGYQPVRARKPQPKKYSHLDMVIMARNIFNHSSLDDVTDSLVAQWLTSSIALIKLFSVNSQYGPYLERLSAIAEFLTQHLANAPFVTSSLVLVHSDVVADVSNLSLDASTCKPNPGESSSPSKACKMYLAPSVPDTIAGIQKPRDSKRSPANLLRIMRKAPSKAFVGRESILRLLADAFWGRSEDDPNNKTLEIPRVAILRGHPAIGKSYIALQAVKSVETCSPFHIHFWITASSVELLKAGLVTLINVVGFKSVDDKSSMADLVGDFRQILRRYSCLLVLDDVVDASLPYVQELVSSLDMRHFVVITTCVKNLELGVLVKQEEIGPLPVEDCFRLLEYIVVGDGLPLRTTNTIKAQRAQIWSDINSNRPVVERILQEALGRSPLGVSLLGQLLISEMSLSAVLARFFKQDDFSTVTKDNRALFADQHSGLDITVRYILARIQQEKRLLELLYAASIMSPNGIPLSLLSNYLGENDKREKSKDLDANFEQHELAALEQTGLLYSEVSAPTVPTVSPFSLQASEQVKVSKEMLSTSSETTYIYIHQLTQRSLRRVLVNDFGVMPTKIHRGLARGFWDHMRMDEHFRVDISCNISDGLKWASRWAECLLSSMFARQVLSGSQKKENKVTSQYSPRTLEIEEAADRSTTVGVCFDKEVIDGLLIASTVLLSLEKTKSDVFLKRFLSSILAVPQVKEPERMVELFLNGTGSRDEAHMIFHFCLASNATLEYFMNAVSLCGRREISYSNAAKQILHYHSFINPNDPAGEAGDVEHLTGVKQELVNLRVLLRCDLALSLLSDLKTDEALVEAEKGAREARSSQRYYYPAIWECRYVTSFCLYYQWNHVAAVETIKPLIEEVTMLKGAREAIRFSSCLAACLMHLGRYEEALEIRRTYLRVIMERFPRGHHVSLAEAHNDIGEVYTKMKNYKMAEKHFREHVEICKELGRPIDHQVVVFYYEWGQYSAALALAREGFIQGKSHARAAAINRLNDLSFLLMAELAMGPSFAKSAQELYTNNHDIVSMCRSEEAPVAYRIYIAMMEARIAFWLGDYQRHWKFAQEAIVMDLGMAAIVVEHLYQNIIILAAAVSAINHGIIEHYLPQRVLSEHTGDSAQPIPMDAELCGKKTQEHARGEAISAKLSGYSQEPEQQAMAACTELLRQVPQALQFCFDHVERFRSQTDMGWLYEVSRDALQISNDSILADILGVKHLSGQAQKFANDTLTYITSAEAEETEWTTLATKLLASESRKPASAS